MTSKSWRPEKWVYGDGYAKPQRVNKHGKGRVKAFEAVADAMLEALRKRGKRSVSFMENGYWLTNPMIVDIPDDLQPVSNPDEFKPKEHLYICPKADRCIYPIEYRFCSHKIPHCTCGGTISNCAPCVPYIEPEKEKVEILSGKSVRQSDNQTIVEELVFHPATKTIEEGYFCEYCFRTISKGNYCGCYFSLEELK